MSFCVISLKASLTISRISSQPSLLIESHRNWPSCYMPSQIHYTRLCHSTQYTVQHSTVQYGTVLCGMVQYSTIWREGGREKWVREGKGERNRERWGEGGRVRARDQEWEGGIESESERSRVGGREREWEGE